MSCDASHDQLLQALARVEAACASDALDHAAELLESFDFELRRAAGADQLDGEQLRDLQVRALRLVDALFRQRESLAVDMAQSQRVGRATRAYLGAS